MSFVTKPTFSVVPFKFALIEAYFGKVKPKIALINISEP